MKKFLIFIFCFMAIVSFNTASHGQNQQLIRILYINDFHGFAESHKPYGTHEDKGGIAYLAALADELRKDKPTLFLAGGDMIQGNNWANLFQGKSVIEVMNAMNFDAMVLGNHEFDFGQEVLKQRVLEANFPVLSANIKGLDFIKPYIIKELSGIRIAIIGITTSDTPTCTHPKNVSNLYFLPPAETVESYIKLLRDNADIIIVLSHIGYLNDMMLAEKVKDIDIIVGGHSHTKLDRAAKIGKTWIVQAWEHAKALGVLDIKIQNGVINTVENHLEEVKPAGLQKNKVVASIVDGYIAKMDSRMKEVIGEALVELNGEGSRTKETNLGNFAADVMREVSGSQLSIINGGMIRASIKKGPVHVEDVYTSLPFDNYAVAISLTGRQIKEALEYGISALEEKEGRFPQVSGISFRYSPIAPKGERIKEITTGGKPIDPGSEYSVATSDFLAAGGDGYKSFGDAIRLSKRYSNIGGTLTSDKLLFSDSGRWFRDAVVDYIKSKKYISPKIEGRIIEESK